MMRSQVQAVSVAGEGLAQLLVHSGISKLSNSMMRRIGGLYVLQGLLEVRVLLRLDARFADGEDDAEQRQGARDEGRQLDANGPQDGGEHYGCFVEAATSPAPMNWPTKAIALTVESSS